MYSERDRPVPEPVDPVAWLALLEGRVVALPCYFAGPVEPWGCYLSTEFMRCPDLPKGPWAPDALARLIAATRSDTVACSGAAIGIAGVAYSTVFVAACAAHGDWLEHHTWMDGMNSGWCAGIGPDGAWTRRNWWTQHPDVIEQWRSDHPGWDAIEPADRAAVVALTPNDGIPNWNVRKRYRF